MPNETWTSHESPILTPSAMKPEDFGFHFAFISEVAGRKILTRLGYSNGDLKKAFEWAQRMTPAGKVLAIRQFYSDAEFAAIKEQFDSEQPKEQVPLDELTGGNPNLALRGVGLIDGA